MIRVVSESSPLEYSPPLLFALAHWARENDEFMPWERRFLYSMGIYAARGWSPTEKQRNHTATLVRRAGERGFSSPQDPPTPVNPLVSEELLARVGVDHVPLDTACASVLELPKHVLDALALTGVTTIRQLMNCEIENLLRVPTLGPAEVQHVSSRLSSYLEAGVGTSRTDLSKAAPRPDAEQDIASAHDSLADGNLLSRCAFEGVPLEHIGIETLELSARAQNALVRGQIKTIAQLAECSVRNVMRLRNVGVTTLSEIKKQLDSCLREMLEHEIFRPESREEVEGGSRDAGASSGVPDRPSSLADLFDEFRMSLSARQAQVLVLRYGLADGMPLTLEQTGQRLGGISKERVRQIQEKVLRKSRHSKRKPLFDAIRQSIILAMAQAGGVLREDEIAKRIGSVAVLGGLSPIGVTYFTLNELKGFIRLADDVWALQTCPTDSIDDVRTCAEELLERRFSRMLFNKLVSEVRERLRVAVRDTDEDFDTLFTEACLRSWNKLVFSDGGLCGLSKWTNTYGDEIVEVLRTAARPLHFTEITAGVKILLEDRPSPSVRSVHATLGRLKSIFGLTGPGTYGLAEWGLERPTHYLDIITDVLQASGRPLTTEEIIRRVDEIRPCKRSSVVMYLTMDERFAQSGPDIFELKEEQYSALPGTSDLPESLVEDLRLRVARDLGLGGDHQRS